MKCPECGCDIEPDEGIKEYRERLKREIDLALKKYELEVKKEMVGYKERYIAKVEQGIIEKARKAARKKRTPKTRKRVIEMIGPGHLAMVYFIKGGEYVKIGKAKDLQKRMSGLQTGYPEKLKLLYAIQVPETKVDEVERKYHEKFKHLNVSGEWFRYDDEIKEHIASLHASN